MSLAQSMNLDSVMAHLTKMSPQQLQQFAAMHKDDPIMLAAASSVKNKMNKLQQSSQAQAQGQPPKVNEQVVQSMAPQGGPQASEQLPEQQGIAQLPTPNMQRMAGGGIIAFADGGYTDDEMYDQSEPVTRMADGGVAHFQTGGQSIMRNPAGGGVLGDLPGAYVPGAPAPSQYVADDSELTVYERAKRALIQSNQEAEARRQGYKSLAEKEAVLGTNKNARDMLLERPQAPSVGAPPTSTGQAGPAQADRAAPPAADRMMPPQAQPRPQPQGGIATIPTKDYRAQMDAYMPKENTDPFAAQRGEVAAAEKAAAEKRLAGFEEDTAARGEAFKGKEARLGTRESELGKQKDLNANLALLDAGLAMMQSRGKGLAGLAEGATVGVKSYASGIERLKLAQEKIDDARDQMEELRRNEANMTAKERRGYKNDIETTVLGAKKDALAGAQQAYGINKQDARTFFAAGQAAEQGALDRASRERIAAAPSGQMQLLQALGGKGGVEEGLRLMTAIQAGKATPAQAWERYITAYAGKDTTVNPPMSPQQFMTQLTQINALSQVPKAGNKPAGQVFE